MVTVPAAALEPWIQTLFERAGLEGEAAATVTGMLVETSLRGVDSHGIARVPIYIERIQAGVINPRPRPAVVRRDGAIATVDGDRGPGQVAGRFATDVSIELAREHGAGIVVVRRSSHYGAAALYARRAAEHGLVALSMTNTEPLVIPYGGAGRALGTNPIALAAPTPDGIFDLDLATSQVAINRIFNARDEGRPIPDDWGVDERGRPTTDAAAVHSAVPLGGYKGYALALLVEILCGVLAGAGVARLGRSALRRGHARAAGRRPLPPRARPGAHRRPRPLRPAPGRAARRPAGDRARRRLRRGARARRSRAAQPRAPQPRRGAGRACSVAHPGRAQPDARSGAS